LTFSLAERWTQAGEPAGIGGEVEFRTDVFDAASIEVLIERLQKVLAVMTADPTRRLSSVICSRRLSTPGWDGWGNRAVLASPRPRRCRFRAVFCCAGGPCSGGGGGGLRTAVVDLP